MPQKKRAAAGKSKSTKATANAKNTTKVTVNVGTAPRPRQRRKAAPAAPPPAASLFQPAVQIINGHHSNAVALENIRGELYRIQDKLKPQIETRIAPPPELSYNYPDIKPVARGINFHDNELFSPMTARVREMTSVARSVQSAPPAVQPTFSLSGPSAEAASVEKARSAATSDIMSAAAKSLRGMSRPEKKEIRGKAFDKILKYNVLAQGATTHNVGGLREGPLRGYQAAAVKVSNAKKNV